MVNEFRSKLLEHDLYWINSASYTNKIKDKRNIIIWGSATTGQCVFDFIKSFDIQDNVKYFADNNEEKWGTKQNELVVLSPSEVVQIKEDIPDIYIIIAAEHLVEIRNQLVSLGIEQNAIDIKGFCLAKEYFEFQKKATAYQVIKSHINEYEEVYSLLADERSKEVYLAVLNYKISLDNDFLNGISNPSNEQYFDKDLVVLKDNEVFCDCGSYNGDTLESFLSESGGRYRKYIAFEADEDIYNELNNKIFVNEYKNVQAYNIACWDKKANLRFKQAQTSGRISDAGERVVRADSLDNILKGKEVTFLKMDIEGAEENAIKGASELIRNNKPTLAICLYHSLEDFYKLPLLIKELNSDYSFFIRHYKDMVPFETVCYAIPRDRLTSDLE
ncbi:FkbM family methyltransferase [Robertmurraya korlensis]|uniref:FkbM family methyltransferase n=1 Tax=Robertmurraya korlensis TaxID=519977 RepID=UPI000826A813|nr:FkbM family methyltransferase [Robertmurraya korlensis]